jgi:DNA-binding NarL/FixJ family response regulator
MVTNVPVLLAGAASSPARILLVEDYEPFRLFTRSMFSKTPALQVICEVSDGVEAVRKAEELQPDLILLDIGLPRLNGIEAARQIRKLAPHSKILIVSQESSVDVIEQALSRGAMGYVIKARAARELLAAVDAVREGRKFVSNGSALKLPTVSDAVTQP